MLNFQVITLGAALGLAVFAVESPAQGASLLRPSQARVLHFLEGHITLKVREIAYADGDHAIIDIKAFNRGASPRALTLSVPSLSTLAGHVFTLAPGAAYKDRLRVPRRAGPANEALSVEVKVDDFEPEEVVVGYRDYRGWAVPADEPELLYAFVDPMDANVQRVANRVLDRLDFADPKDITASGPTAQLAAISEVFEALQDLGLRRRYDPLPDGQRDIEHVQFPSETLFFGGDCEDMAILWASVLEALEVPARLVSTPKHVFLVAGLSMAAGQEPRVGDEALSHYLLGVEGQRLVRSDAAEGETLSWLPLEPMAHTDPLANASKLWRLGQQSSEHALYGPRHQVLHKGAGSAARVGHSRLRDVTLVPLEARHRTRRHPLRLTFERRSLSGPSRARSGSAEPRGPSPHRADPRRTAARTTERPLRAPTPTHLPPLASRVPSPRR